MTEHDPSQDAGSGRFKDERSGSGGREAAWDDVAASFSNLGKQVRKRFERPGGETAGPETAGPEPAVGETPSTREGADGDKVRRVIDKLDDTFTKLGETMRDPEFRKEAGSSVGRLGEALGVTLRDLGDQLQGRFGRSRTETAPGEDMPDVPPPPPASTPPTSDVPAAPPTPPTSDVPAAPPTPPTSDVPPAPPASTPPVSDMPPPPPPASPKPDAGAPGEAPPDEPPRA